MRLVVLVVLLFNSILWALIARDAKTMGYRNSWPAARALTWASCTVTLAWAIHLFTTINPSNP